MLCFVVIIFNSLLFNFFFFRYIFFLMCLDLVLEDQQLFIDLFCLSLSQWLSLPHPLWAPFGSCQSLWVCCNLCLLPHLPSQVLPLPGKNLRCAAVF